MKDIYAEITQNIITQLEMGIIPWKKPWTGVSSGAISHNTLRPYSLINQLLLWEPGEYITFNQCKAEGGKVNKGAQGKTVVFWKPILYKYVDDNGNDVLDDKGDPVTKMRPVLRYYTVFHIERDCTGIEPKLKPDMPINPATIDENAQKTFDAYITREGVGFIQSVSNEASYSPWSDTISVPAIEQFEKTAEYYSTLYHEAVHSTGHKSRLDRFSDGNVIAAFGDESYSKEELVAEIGSACVLHELGIDTPSSFRNSAAYIQSWLSHLKNDKRLIISAASRAEKAAKLILNITE